MSTNQAASPMAESQDGQFPAQLGMTLRDYFAIKALPLSANNFSEGHQDGMEGIARHAYKWADAMLEARKS